jgi:hypothetical protein
VIAMQRAMPQPTLRTATCGPTPWRTTIAESKSAEFKGKINEPSEFAPYVRPLTALVNFPLSECRASLSIEIDPHGSPIDEPDFRFSRLLASARRLLGCRASFGFRGFEKVEGFPTSVRNFQAESMKIAVCSATVSCASDTKSR